MDTQAASGEHEDYFSSDWLRARKRKLEYLRRAPENTATYRVVFHHHEELEHVWDEHYAERYGRFREEVKDSFYKYLDCGILLHGCARARCAKCNHSELLALSCKCRGICASCDTKRMLLFAENLHEEVLESVPHRHVVLTIPRRLRAFFRYNRSRNSFLFDASRSAIRELYQELNPDATPGAVLALHSGNDLQEYNPHLHGIIADGVFQQDGTFEQLSLEQESLKKLFEHHLLKRLLDDGAITETLVAQLSSQTHSGFSAWLGRQINPADTQARLFISEYVNKAQVKNSKIELVEDDSLFRDNVVRCYKDDTTYKDYTPLDFLAHLSTHIPDRWEQTVRYIGWYSARTRGKRRKELAEQDVDSEPTLLVIPEEKDTEYKKSKRKSWARLIRKVFEVDPLVCPKCGSQMEVIAVITDPKEARRISSHLGYRYRAPPPLKNSSGQQQYTH